MTTPAYRRIVLKLSGDILKGGAEGGINFEIVERIAREIASTSGRGVETAVVVGGGNLIRGAEAARAGLDRITADNMGMLSTVINAMAMQNALEILGIETRVMSAITITELVEPFIRRRAIRHLEKGRVVIFAAGTGNPFFTTDTAAALRAGQIEAEIILKGTKVDGVYDNDPELVKDAVKFDEVDFMEVIRRGLKVMDLTAITFCRDYNIP
ncbi:MAG TPA: UMP kinase, partial [Bacteroidetes bacterium]|nr:UMP kinase [Bacteroidota bacterium]